MDSTDRLTDRQKGCLRLVGQGYTSKEIGRHLGISPATVDNHIRAALEILQVDHRAEAARMLRLSEDGQPLTSQLGELAAPADPAPIEVIQPKRQTWLRWLVPPLGGTRNDLNWEAKNLAIIRIALFGLVALVLMTLGTAMLLWALR